MEVKCVFRCWALRSFRQSIGIRAGHFVEQGRHLFVTSGVGTSILPVRFGVTPEIVILTLVGDK